MFSQVKKKYEGLLLLYYRTLHSPFIFKILNRLQNAWCGYMHSFAKFMEDWAVINVYLYLDSIIDAICSNKVTPLLNSRLCHFILQVFNVISCHRSLMCTNENNGCDPAVKIGIRKCLILTNCNPFKIYYKYAHFRRTYGEHYQGIDGSSLCKWNVLKI